MFGSKAKETRSLTISRKEVLEADTRYRKDGLYSADYRGCLYFYKFLLTKNLPSVHLVGIRNYMSLTYDLTARNICCFKNILNSIKMNDENAFWHELSDFIHNYNNSNPITYDEYNLFMSMFEFGVEIWNKNISASEVEDI